MLCVLFVLSLRIDGYKFSVNVSFWSASNKHITVLSTVKIARSAMSKQALNIVLQFLVDITLIPTYYDTPGKWNT